MKSASLLALATAVLALGSGCGAESGNARPADGTPSAAGAATSSSEVTAAVREDLRFLREEEKLARDVYAKLYERWQLVPYRNIGSSEQRHTSRVKDTLASLGIPDPVQDDSVGVFANVELRTLYGELVASGMQSEVAALTVGATIEDLDIRDIERMKGRTTDPSVLALYDSLQCGSRNHLRAYTSQLASRGVTYTARYIGAPELASIRAASNERCGP